MEEETKQKISVIKTQLLADAAMQILKKYDYPTTDDIIMSAKQARILVKELFNKVEGGEE